MKTDSEIRIEIEALRRLGEANPGDRLAQASIAGQINVLEWAVSKSQNDKWWPFWG